MKKGIFVVSIMLSLFSLIVPIHANAAGTLVWNASTGVVQGYRVYYGTTANGVYPNSANAGTATSYALNNLPMQENSTYYFVVRAYNESGESTNSNQVSFLVPESTPPSPPQGVTVTLGLAGSATMNWQPNTETDLAKYRVYCSTTNGAFGSYKAEVPKGTTTYVANGLTERRYYFVLTAVDASGNESGYSSPPVRLNIPASKTKTTKN